MNMQPEYDAKSVSSLSTRLIPKSGYKRYPDISQFVFVLYMHYMHPVLVAAAVTECRLEELKRISANQELWKMILSEHAKALIVNAVRSKQIEKLNWLSQYIDVLAYSFHIPKV